MDDRSALGARTENKWPASHHRAPDAAERDVLRDQNRLWLGMAAARLPEVENGLPLLSLVAAGGRLGGHPYGLARSTASQPWSPSAAECGDHRQSECQNHWRRRPGAWLRW